MFKKFLASVAVVAMLSACAQPGDRNSGVMSGGGINKADVGTIAGAGLGAVLGSNVGKGKGNIAAIAAGTLLGAALGNSIGASLDRADMAYYNQTSQRTLETAPTGQVQTWRNPDSGNSGTIVVTKTEGYCREYQQTITVGGKTEKAYGRACRQPDGQWQVVQ